MHISHRFNWIYNALREAAFETLILLNSMELIQHEIVDNS